MSMSGVINMRSLFDLRLFVLPPAQERRTVPVRMALVEMASPVMER